MVNLQYFIQFHFDWSNAFAVIMALNFLWIHRKCVETFHMYTCMVYICVICIYCTRVFFLLVFVLLSYSVKSVSRLVCYANDRVESGAGNPQYARWTENKKRDVDTHSQAYTIWVMLSFRAEPTETVHFLTPFFWHCQLPHPCQNKQSQDKRDKLADKRGTLHVRFRQHIIFFICCRSTHLWYSFYSRVSLLLLSFASDGVQLDSSCLCLCL